MLFLYCFFGKLAIDSFARMADSLFEANWQDLPINLQKYFILMIANSQKPIYYHGFGVAILNLETFCKVILSSVLQTLYYVQAFRNSFRFSIVFSNNFLTVRQISRHLLHDV